MPASGARATHRARVAEALRLHQSGSDARTIAVQLGCTPARAAKLLAEALRSTPGSDVDDLRTASEVRLDRLAATYGSMLDSEDERIRLAAANGMRQVEADRSRLLGLWQRPEPAEPSNR